MMLSEDALICFFATLTFAETAKIVKGRKLEPLRDRVFLLLLEQDHSIPCLLCCGPVRLSLRLGDALELQ